MEIDLKLSEYASVIGLDNEVDDAVVVVVELILIIEGDVNGIV